MKHLHQVRLLVIGLILTAWFVSPAQPGTMPAFAAPNNDPPGPDRYTSIRVDYTKYTWWLARWSNSKVVCEITVDHDGQPSLGEVYRDCDQDVYDNWIVQEPCPQLTLAEDPSGCKGYYMHFVDSFPAQKEIPVALPPPVIWVSLENCSPSMGTFKCSGEPYLILSGDEPLPNEHIERIEGLMDGEPFTCGAICPLELFPTSEIGIVVEFWAYSSYGDSSQIFSAEVRVTPVDQENLDDRNYYIDVLSSQWAGQPRASCAETWEAFPPVGGTPPWLTTPEESSQLNSTIPYSYLAGNLIMQGVVDAGDCVDGGLMPDGSANSCGMDKARLEVDVWQNRFDDLILKAARDSEVPAQLLKNLFARESQLWPGVYTALGEAGFGQLTEDGADTTLLWNPSFYEQYCPLVLPWDTCKDGYLNLKEKERELLRNALVSSVVARCSNCVAGLDLSQADFSISVFANTLLASCEQTGRIVRNVSRTTPGKAASYEDLWKMTLANYNAGPGCLSEAVQAAFRSGQKLTWEDVAHQLDPACQGAVEYVADISK